MTKMEPLLKNVKHSIQKLYFKIITLQWQCGNVEIISWNEPNISLNPSIHPNPPVEVPNITPIVLSRCSVNLHTNFNRGNKKIVFLYTIRSTLIFCFLYISPDIYSACVTFFKKVGQTSKKFLSILLILIKPYYIRNTEMGACLISEVWKEIGWSTCVKSKFYKSSMGNIM
jgi:hypothetical protein